MMAPETSRRLAWAIGLVSIAFMLARLVLMYVDRSAVLDDAAVGLLGARDGPSTIVLSDVVNLAVPIIGIILATRVPDNRLGWMFLVAGVFLALASFGQVYAQHALLIDPGSWAGGRIRALVGDVGLDRADRDPARPGDPAVPDGPPALPLVAPSVLVHGDRCRPPRERGLWCTRRSAGPTSSHESEPTGTIGLLFELAFVGMVIALIPCVVSVVVRFRAARGAERLQLKGFLVAALLVGATFVLNQLVDTPVMSILSSLSLLLLWVAIAIAVVRYRLYDIDVVISRAVVFGALVVFITVVYVAVVVGVGALAGEGRSPLLAALAAAIVALAFQPVRGWARRLANRVVYGRRATPYEVLSEFSEQLAGHVLDRGRAAADGVDRRGRDGRRAHDGVAARGRASCAPRPGPAIEPDVRTIPIADGELPPMPDGEAAVSRSGTPASCSARSRFGCPRASRSARRGPAGRRRRVAGRAGAARTSG